MSFSGHFFTGYVRVLGSSIRMPTSTVKHVSGPPQPRKTEPERPFTVQQLMQFFKGKALRPGVRAALFTVCGFAGLANLTSVKAQALRVRITVTSVAPARIRIDAEF